MSPMRAARVETGDLVKVVLLDSTYAKGRVLGTPKDSDGLWVIEEDEENLFFSTFSFMVVLEKGDNS
jgi:hypothetical protein